MTQFCNNFYRSVKLTKLYFDISMVIMLIQPKPLLCQKKKKLPWDS